MAQQIINIGTSPNDGTGDNLRNAFDKTNDNFDELYTNRISGSGTDNYIPRFNGTNALENSIIFDNGTNIGIGTASPSTKLEVVGNFKTSLSGYEFQVYPAFDTNVVGMGASSNHNLAIVTNATERMRITSTGNVGIGTTSPATKFHIQDTNGGIFFDGSGATYNRFKSTTSSASVGRDLLFSAQNSGTTPDLYITSGGNVGIGTSSPSDTLSYGKALDVQGTDGSALYLRSATNSSTVYAFFSYDNNEVRTNIGGIGTSNYLRFISGSTERMRIASNGNVGIGTTSPGSKLSIIGLPTSSAGLSSGDIWNDGGTLKIV